MTIIKFKDDDMKQVNIETFIIELKNSDRLMSDVIFTGDKPTDEFWALGFPTEINRTMLEFLEFEPVDDECDFYFLHKEEIKTYTPPSTEMMGKYNFLKYHNEMNLSIAH